MQRYGLQQTVPPDSEPVSIEEAKDHCRVSVDDDDTLIADLISAARESLEAETWRQFLTATYVMSLDGFPSYRMIRLPRPPLQSVTSITYYDSDGTLQTLATSVYGTEALQEPGMVYLKHSQIWPITYSIPSAVRITFVAGWEDQTLVPIGLRHAIKLLVGHWYENREASAEKAMSDIPMGVQRLVWQNTMKEAV